MMDQTKQSK